MDETDINNIANATYHIVALTVLTVGISIGAKKIIGTGIGDLSRPGLAEVFKLAVALALAFDVKRMFEKAAWENYKKRNYGK